MIHKFYLASARGAPHDTPLDGSDIWPDTNSGADVASGDRLLSIKPR